MLDYRYFLCYNSRSMGKDIISIELAARKVVGKKVKAMRRAGDIPAVIHNHGKDSIIASAATRELEKVYREAGKHHPVEVKVDKNDFLALIKDVDIDPVKHRMRHVVFQAIRRDEKTEAEIPLHLEGEIPAERKSLLVITGIDHIVVEALPQDLPDSIKVDATVLDEIGDKITVADLQMPAGVTVMTEPEQVIAHVEEPKVHEIEEPEAEAEEGAEGEEGEATAEGEEKPAEESESKKESSTEKE